MYQRHLFGTPPPIFTPPPAPYNPKHHAYATGKQPTSSSEVAKPNTKVPHQDGGFPAQLSLLTENKPQPVPAVDFSGNITQSIADVLNKELKIYVTPTDYFTTKFRQIFTSTKVTFTSAKYARKWLGGPNISFWPQQLNFALWRATTGCGVSREILFSSGSSLNLTPQIHSFYLFHVYYTTRKILYELGGIQSDGALPDDPVFKQKGSVLSSVLTQTLIFATKKARTTVLARYLFMSRAGPVPTGMSYPSEKAKFGDEGGNASDGNAVYFIRNDDGTDKQFEYFAPNNAKGFTNIGFARINQSIQAYCYSVLGAQANSHTSIIGDSGSAKNTQLDFLILVEDAITTLDASNGPVKYQDAIERTKTRLDFAIAQGVLLMPSCMIINTKSIVGYNNLTRAKDDMKLGVNNDVNQGTHKASLEHMAGGPSKINPPNSHPSNPIHKQATEAQGLAVKKKPTQTQTPPTQTTITQPRKTTTDAVDSHHINKALVVMGALAFVGLIVYAAS